MAGLIAARTWPQRLRRQARIRVQEQQDVGVGLGRAGIHLRRAVAFGFQQTDSRVMPHDVARGILVAAAVNDDDPSGACARTSVRAG